MENDRNGRRENTLVKMVDKIQMGKERRTKEKKRTNNRKGEWDKVNKKNDEKKSEKGWKKKERGKKNKWNRACVGTLS